MFNAASCVRYPVSAQALVFDERALVTGLRLGFQLTRLEELSGILLYRTWRDVSTGKLGVVYALQVKASSTEANER